MGLAPWGWSPLSLSSPQSTSQLTPTSSPGTGAQPSSSHLPAAGQGEHPPPTPACLLRHLPSLLAAKHSNPAMESWF